MFWSSPLEECHLLDETSRIEIMVDACYEKGCTFQQNGSMAGRCLTVQLPDSVGGHRCASHSVVHRVVRSRCIQHYRLGSSSSSVSE